ncbi:hypothetical protein [Marinibacterium sp. SX1]|uniref:hypothetical protein n=1 Tax=Marinibacterium sp. SX1 TaxID=3388424 RepID=UPI003D1756C1
MIRKLLLMLVAVMPIAGAWPAQGAARGLEVRLLEPWNGRRVPAGQQCRMFGGDGATPPMQVWNMPAETVWIVAQFNDSSFKPLSRGGGHGQIAWPVSWPVTYLYPVPGMNGLPKWGAFVVEPARTIGIYASPGYLPPCSGGRRHKYTVDILAVDGDGNLLEERRNIAIGKY